MSFSYWQHGKFIIWMLYTEAANAVWNIFSWNNQWFNQFNVKCTDHIYYENKSSQIFKNMDNCCWKFLTWCQMLVLGVVSSLMSGESNKKWLIKFHFIFCQVLLLLLSIRLIQAALFLFNTPGLQIKHLFDTKEQNNTFSLAREKNIFWKAFDPI